VLSLFGFIFWSLVFGSAIVIIMFPGLTGKFANILGIGRGADVVIYVSISLIFYLVFRLYVYIEDIRHDITDLVKKIAIDNEKSKKTTKN
jgi:hypothetical protein